MRCFFCFNEREVRRLSKEHLLSKPVASAFGIDRSGWLGQLNDGDQPPITSRLDAVSVRFVCEPCNNVWMNALEHEMAAVAEWIDARRRPLGMTNLQAIQRWGLKTYLLLSVMVGGARRFQDDPSGPGVIPNFTRARELFESNPDAFRGMVFGVSKSASAASFAYIFGNPRVLPEGPNYVNCKSASVAVVRIGLLQIWVVDPIIFDQARVTLPGNVHQLRPELTFRRLRPARLDMALDCITVTNPEHHMDDLLAALDAAARKAG